MKILFLTGSLQYGGAERQLVLLAVQMHQKGHGVGVAVFYPGGPLEADLVRAGVTVHHLNKRGRWDAAGFLWRLTALIRRERPDILHGYLVVPNLITVGMRLCFPRMKAVWGVRASHVDLTRYDWLSRVTFWTSRVFSRFAHLIVVNSQAGKIHHARLGYPDRRMVVIPNGIDTDRFLPDKSSGEALRNTWGVKPGEKLVGLVGRLDPMKDHPVFMEAAAEVVKTHPTTRFVCVGEGPEPYAGQLKQQAEALGLASRWIWAGAAKEMAVVYNSLDCLASSSYGEGFPNVVAEAMACGVPCVVTDVGDSAWIVGRLGVVVPPKSPQALASGISRVLDQPQHFPREKLRESVVSRFSVEALVLATEQALEGVLTGQPTRKGG